MLAAVRDRVEELLVGPSLLLIGEVLIHLSPVPFHRLLDISLPQGLREGDHSVSAIVGEVGRRTPDQLVRVLGVSQEGSREGVAANEQGSCFGLILPHELPLAGSGQLEVELSKLILVLEAPKQEQELSLACYCHVGLSLAHQVPVIASRAEVRMRDMAMHGGDGGLTMLTLAL